MIFSDTRLMEKLIIVGTSLQNADSYRTNKYTI